MSISSIRNGPSHTRSLSLEHLSKLTSSVDFISSLSASDLGKATHEKFDLLYSFGKSFEQGYHYQCELNEKLKTHLEYKEKEYLQHEEQMLKLQDRIQAQKKEIRRLEDLVLQLTKDRDNYKAKCKKLSQTLKQLGQILSQKFASSANEKNHLEEQIYQKLFKVLLDAGVLKENKKEDNTDCALIPNPSNLQCTQKGPQENQKESAIEQKNGEFPSSQLKAKPKLTIPEEFKHLSSNTGLPKISIRSPDGDLKEVGTLAHLDSEEGNGSDSPGLKNDLEENKKKGNSSPKKVKGISDGIIHKETKIGDRLRAAKSEWEIPARRGSPPNKFNLKCTKAVTMANIDEKRVENLKKSIVVLADRTARRSFKGSMVFSFERVFSNPSNKPGQTSEIDLNSPPKEFSKAIAAQSQGQTNKLKLFEEFFIIGVEKKDIEQFEKENSDKASGTLKPKILYNYPSFKTALDLPSRASVADFAFPFGVEIKRDKIRSSSNIYEVMFPKYSYDDNSNCFVFPLLSGEIDENFGADCEILIELNPDRLLYHICIKTTDFIDFGYIEEDSKEILQSKTLNKRRKRRKVWKVAKVYCFMTFLPLIKLFMDINCKVLNVLKIERMTLFSKLTAENKDPLQAIDDKWVNQFVEKQLVSYLQAIIEHPLPKLGSFFELKYKDYDQIKSYIGEKDYAGNQAFAWAYPTVFTYFTFKDLWLIFSIMINERKLVILSKNLALLSSTLLVLHTMLRPFKYTYPLIFNIPELLLSLFDAPGSGLNQGLEYLEKEELSKSFPDCFFIVLGEQKPLMIADSTMLKTIVHPNFKGLEAKIEPHYSNFNKDTTSNMFVYSSTEEIDSNIISKYFGEHGVRKGHSRRNSHATSKGAETEHALAILKVIQRAFMKEIIELIPENPIYSEEMPGELDYKAIGNSVIGKSPDNQFLKEFVTTQIFTYYIEQKYEDATK